MISRQKIQAAIDRDYAKYEDASEQATRSMRLRNRAGAAAIVFTVLTGINEAADVVPEPVPNIPLVGAAIMGKKAFTANKRTQDARHEAMQIATSAAELADPKYYPSAPVPVAGWITDALPAEQAKTLLEHAQIWGEPSIDTPAT